MMTQASPRRAAPKLTVEKEQACHQQIESDANPSVCRICWQEEVNSNEDVLVTPCKCTGSMKYVHTSCLGRWQSHLRLQKGIFASRKCDVCKSVWRNPYNNILNHGRPTLPQVFVSGYEAARPYLNIVWEWFKALTLARAVLSGLENGVHGFALGMKYRSLALTEAAQPLLAFSPWSLFAVIGSPTGVVPFSTFVMLYGAISAVGALHGCFFAIAGAWAGLVSGFSDGLASTLLMSMKAGGSILSAALRLFARIFSRR